MVRASIPSCIEFVKVVLISTYELGRQPFGLASPAAWLRQAGAEVVCVDTSVQDLPVAVIRDADLLAFYLPMHTATRKAIQLLPRVRRINSRASLCFYGLYAPVNAGYLRSLGADMILGGEFEEALVSWAKWRAEKSGSSLHTEKPQASTNVRERFSAIGSRETAAISLARQKFLPPDRSSLPSLERYGRLTMPDGQRRIVGYTEASRGCKHLCRHCPVVPVYQGQFRVIQPQVVLSDITTQVEMGAQHITFGDPDFFNGIGHALALIKAMHERHPGLTYDVTIKIEHLLKYSNHLATLRETGCLFVTSAVESIDDRVLRLLEKGHTREDFLVALQRCRSADLVLSPTFIPFTPWTTLEDYRALLELLADEALVEQVAPVQLAIRLLIPAGSRLLELAEVRELASRFDPQALSYRWNHPDPRMDALQRELLLFIHDGECRGLSRQDLFSGIWKRAQGEFSRSPIRARPPRLARAAVPYLTEPWYC